MAKRKSMADIDSQYDRIKARIRRYAINDEISIESERKALANLDKVYDKYQDNNAKALGYGGRVAMNKTAPVNPNFEKDYNRQLSYRARSGATT